MTSTTVHSKQNEAEINVLCAFIPLQNRNSNATGHRVARFFAFDEKAVRISPSKLDCQPRVLDRFTNYFIIINRNLIKFFVCNIDIKSKSVLKKFKFNAR